MCKCMHGIKDKHYIENDNRCMECLSSQLREKQDKVPHSTIWGGITIIDYYGECSTIGGIIGIITYTVNNKVNLNKVYDYLEHLDDIPEDIEKIIKDKFNISAIVI